MGMEDRAAILHQLDAFDSLIDRMIGLSMDCQTGFRHNKAHVEICQNSRLAELRKKNSAAAMEDDDRSPIYLSRVDPDVREAKFQHATTIGGYKERNNECGDNTILMHRSIIVTLYSFWEQRFRPAIAAAAKRDESQITGDIFGDLRILRNCIIHRLGSCDEKIKKMTLLTWFSEGDEIVFTQEMMDRLFFEVKSAIRVLGVVFVGVDVAYSYERSLQPGIPSEGASEP
jgi:hypothetical protein